MRAFGSGAGKTWLEFHAGSGSHDDVPWAYVVQVLDLLLATGRTDVFLSRESLRLELGARVTPPDPRGAPLVTRPVLIACAVAVLLAFACTFVPLRRGRQRRRPGPGTAPSAPPR